MEEYQDTLQKFMHRLESCTYFVDTIDKTLDGISIQSKALEKDNEQLVEFVKDLNEALAYYKKGVDVIYKRTIQDLENQLTELMQEVFSGCQYGVHFIIEDLRGVKNLIIEMFDEKFQGAPEDMGGSLETVVGYLFHLMYLIKVGKPRFLFMDEMFKDLYPDYAINLIELINRITKATNSINVLITHDLGLECIVDKVYTVSEGNYTVNQKEV